MPPITSPGTIALRVKTSSNLPEGQASLPWPSHLRDDGLLLRYLVECSFDSRVTVGRPTRRISSWHSSSPDDLALALPRPSLVPCPNTPIIPRRARTTVAKKHLHPYISATGPGSACPTRGVLLSQTHGAASCRRGRCTTSRSADFRRARARSKPRSSPLSTCCSWSRLTVSQFAER
jgi:hypothetical protein